MENRISKYVNFSEVSDMLEKISVAKKKDEILQKYIISFKKFQSQFKEQYPSNCDASFYPILRILLPSCDRERASYGIKTKTLRDIYIKILGIHETSDAAKSLSAHDSTDFADKVFKLMRGRCKEVGELTVFDVNRHLDAIAEHNQNNSRLKIHDELIKMIEGMSQLDQKWLIRIILKNLRLGLGQHKIFSTYHPSANDFFDLYSNLSKVCQSVENGEKIIARVEASGVELFYPVKPMLCQRINLKLVDSLIKSKEFYLETKMDGERFHIHKKEQKYKYFSRNGKDYSDAFDSTLTSYLDKLFLIPVENIILDGEMMVWDKEEMQYRDKSENIDAKSLRADNPTLRPCFCVYDILFLNGKSLIDKPNAERIRLLNTLVKDHVGIFTKCTRLAIRDSDHILECLNKAFDDKEEGVVIKDQDSIYKPNDRNAGWYKIKPDYIDNLVSDFDLLIVGGYYNASRSFITAFLVAIVDRNRENEDNSTFLAVTKVGQGLSTDKWRELNKSLKPHWNAAQVKKVGRQTVSVEPPNIKWGHTYPNVWIEPKNSIVLEIKASELVKSSSFPVNYTLRFPRITSIRSDKGFMDCCTKEEFVELCSSNSKVEKLTKRHVTNDDLVGEIPKKVTKRKQISPLVLHQSNSEELVSKIDDICDGLDFCILNMKNKKELEQLVLKHGGRAVQNPSPKTFVIIAGDLNFHVRNLSATKKYNIARVSWLLRALNGSKPQKVLMDFHPNDMIATTAALDVEFLEKFDPFGDSYTEKWSVPEFKTFLSNVDIQDNALTNRELFEGEKEILGHSKLFRLHSALFYEENLSTFVEKTRVKCEILKFVAQGGQMVKSAGMRDNYFNVNYIFIYKNNIFNLFKFEQWTHKLHLEQKNVEHLNCDWISACCKRQQIVDSCDFKI